MNLIIFTEDGKIQRKVSVPADAAYLQASVANGESFIEDLSTHTADLDTDYVVNSVCVKRPVAGIEISGEVVNANGTDTTTLINLPDPCTITYTGPGFELTNEVTGGTAEFTTDVAGTHTIKVVAFPYLDWEGTFDAV